MIGKIVKGRSFHGLFKYILNPAKKPTVLELAKHCLGDTPTELTEEFMMIADLRPTTQKPVRHFALSFSPGDGEIDDDIKTAIAIRVMDDMGYADCQYIAVAHHRDDPGHKQHHDHDHLHIVANAVTLYGDRVSDFWDFPKLENCLRGIERDFRLERVKCSWERNRPSVLEDPTQLQQKVVEAFEDRPTLAVGIERLEASGVNLKFAVTRNGIVKGLNYIEDGTAYKGGDIGLSWRVISKQITPTKQDLETIAAANIATEAIAVKASPEMMARFRQAAQLAEAIVDKHGDFENARIGISKVDGKLTLKRIRPERTILRVELDEAGDWKQVGGIDVRDVDLQLVTKAANKLGVSLVPSTPESIPDPPPPTVDSTNAVLASRQLRNRGYDR